MSPTFYEKNLLKGTLKPKIEKKGSATPILLSYSNICRNKNRKFYSNRLRRSYSFD